MIMYLRDVKVYFMRCVILFLNGIEVYIAMNGWKEKLSVTIMDNVTHVVFRCPNCRQKIRVLRGRGNICIKCPRCRIEFFKKT